MRKITCAKLFSVEREGGGPPRGEAGATPLELARVCKAWARVTGGLLALARIRVPRLSPIGNRRNPPPRAEKAANFFRPSARAGWGISPARKRFQENWNKAFAADAATDDNAPVAEGGNDHPAHKVAAMLVQSGSHSTHEDALAYLLHHPRGAALLRRLTKSEDTPNMTTPEEKLSDLVKRVGITAIAAEIIKSDSAYSITEHELTDLVTEQAMRDNPTLSAAQAFTKVFMDQSEAGTVLRRAFNVIKTASAAPYFDLKPLVVGGEDAQDVDDPAKAVAQLQELGRQKWPTASEAQQFANAFDDPANAKLAAKAHRRPAATTVYPFPK